MRVAPLFSLAAVSTLVACVQATPQPTPTTDEEKALYGMGVLLADNLNGFDLTDEEMAMLRAGLSDAVKDESKLKHEEIEPLLPKIQELRNTRMAAALESEKKAGSEYLAKAATEDGAVKTDSGMVFKSTSEGSGASPAAEDTVKVNYEGRLVNGKVFDSSEEPVEFPLNGVIPCWTEGVQKMKVGGKAQLVCPPELAYGDRGSPPQMPGGATLVFDVELLEVTKGGPAAGAPEAAAP